MLFALGLVSMFTIGGITGVFLASIPLDIPLQDTYFVVAHFHYVLFGGTILGFFAGLYFWFPKMTGRMYHEGLGKLHFALTLIGFNLTFWPMHELGMAGMPRRIATYSADTGWGPLNMVATAGALLLGLAQLLMVANFLWSRKRGAKAGDNPWGASGLEWTVSSPPPPHNFDGVPVVIDAPGEAHHKGPGSGALAKRLLGK
jgi:cytochrome c oxidase subunit 1